MCNLTFLVSGGFDSHVSDKAGHVLRMPTERRTEFHQQFHREDDQLAARRPRHFL